MQYLFIDGVKRMLHLLALFGLQSQLKDLREELTTERKQVTAFRDQVLSLKSGSADAAEKVLWS